MSANEKDVKDFFRWIREQACHFRGVIITYDKDYPSECSTHWDEDKGIWRNQVSHILRKGSVRRNEHFGNVFSNCDRHHRWFERLNPFQRAQFLRYGEMYHSEYLNQKVRKSSAS